MRRRSLVICGDGASAVALLCALARNGESPLDITMVGAGWKSPRAKHLSIRDAEARMMAQAWAKAFLLPAPSSRT